MGHEMRQQIRNVFERGIFEVVGIAATFVLIFGIVYYLPGTLSGAFKFHSAALGFFCAVIDLLWSPAGARLEDFVLGVSGDRGAVYLEIGVVARILLRLTWGFWLIVWGILKGICRTIAAVVRKVCRIISAPFRWLFGKKPAAA